MTNATSLVAAGLVLAVGLSGAEVQAQAKRPMTFDDFTAVRVVGDPQLSPDGKSVLYSVRVTDIAANRKSGSIWAPARSQRERRQNVDSCWI